MMPSNEALRMVEEWPTVETIEIAAKAFHAKLFSDDPREVHMAASPVQVDIARESVRKQMEIVLTACRPKVAEGIQGIMDERDDAKRMLLNSRCQNASLQAELAQKDAEIAALRLALEPFAKAADIKLCGDWRDDERFGQTDVAFHLTFGDLRRARAAIATEDGKHE